MIYTAAIYVVSFLLLAVLAGFVFTLWHTASVNRQYPAIGKTVEVDGGKLHYLERGAGPPVVLLHGASGNLREWTTTIFDDLAKRYRVIAIDRPGHGQSPFTDPKTYDPRIQAGMIADLLKQIGAERPIIVGHSMSGSVALALALDYPQQVGGVLFLSGVSHPWPGGVEGYRRLAVVPGVGAAFAATLVAPIFKLVLNRGLASVFHPNPIPPRYAENSGVALSARPQNFRTNAFEIVGLNAILATMARRYSEISAPLIALAGDQDKVVWTDLHSVSLIDQVQNGELRVVPGLGHMPHHTIAPQVIDAIDDLARLRAPSQRPLESAKIPAEK